MEKGGSKKEKEIFKMYNTVRRANVIEIRFHKIIITFYENE